MKESELHDFINSTNLKNTILNKENIKDKIILHTYKGVVCAKTNGQKSYLDAVNNNDMQLLQLDLLVLEKHIKQLLVLWQL